MTIPHMTPVGAIINDKRLRGDLLRKAVEDNFGALADYEIGEMRIEDKAAKSVARIEYLEDIIDAAFECESPEEAFYELGFTGRILTGVMFDALCDVYDDIEDALVEVVKRRSEIVGYRGPVEQVCSIEIKQPWDDGSMIVIAIPTPEDAAGETPCIYYNGRGDFVFDAKKRYSWFMTPWHRIVRVRPDVRLPKFDVEGVKAAITEQVRERNHMRSVVSEATDITFDELLASVKGPAPARHWPKLGDHGDEIQSFLLDAETLLSGARRMAKEESWPEFLANLKHIDRLVKGMRPLAATRNKQSGKRTRASAKRRKSEKQN